MKANLKQHVLKLMRQHGIHQFDYSDEQQTISLSLSTQKNKATRAPFAGYFFQKHPMTDQNLTSTSTIRKGEIIGYIKNGPLLRPVLAAEDCHTNVAKVVDGTSVGYGDLLCEFSAVSPDDV